MADRRRVKGEASAPPAGPEDAPQPRGFKWDDRRQLALDICALAAPDVPGALLIARNFREQEALALREALPPAERVRSWDASGASMDDAWGGPPLASDADGVLGPGERLQLECGVDLDAASDALLRALRAYVDACFVPVLAPKQNCAVCQGLWSCGRVAACGNDACGLRVHEECFGVLLRARGDDGPWRCPSCLLGCELVCAVCMQAGGALKPLASAAATAAARGQPLPPTSAGAAADAELKWVHVLCALAIPELLLRDVPTMEPVDGFDEIENGRFRYLCSVCRKRGGASVICEHEACNVGMHPQCAADAGLMIGSEANALGVFCEKHLPLARVPGATRWISDEDLVEDIMSEYSVDEDFFGDQVLLDDGSGAGNLFSASNRDKYAFVLESTAYLARRLELLGGLSTSRAPPFTASKARARPEKRELQARDVRAVNPSALAPPDALVQAAQSQRTPVFPPPPPLGTTPSEQLKLGLPPFPQREAAVGAIVELRVKEQDAWERAQVLQWDGARAMHLVQLVRTSQRLYASLSTDNTLVLYLPGEENLVDGVRVKLYRPRTDQDGGHKDGKKSGKASASATGTESSGAKADGRQWRPRPREFARQ